MPGSEARGRSRDSRKESGTTLSALVLTRHESRGLPTLLDQLALVADEIVVGVDSHSSREALEVVVSRSDRVFRFENHGPPVRVRLASLGFASSDWILTIDEDELLDQALARILPELITDSRFTHYWFPRKWVTGSDATNYLHGPPWHPDWQLRLFRNDPSRFWHPGVVHSGYYVVGSGSHEERGAILHYEDTFLTEAQRAAKIKLYRRYGSGGVMEDFYGRRDAEHRPLEHPPADADERPRERDCRIDPKLLAALPAPAHPPWGAELEVRMPRRAVCGTRVTVEVRATNIGILAWSPPGPDWPRLSLSYHLHDGNRTLTSWDGPRFPIPRDVAPGEKAVFLATLTAPTEPGDYLLEWDLVSEDQYWFSDCGSSTAWARLTAYGAKSRPT